MADVVLEARAVDVRYGGSRILRDVSIAVPRRSIAAVMGRNGMGKTTLLKALVGLLAPVSGSVHFDGDDITRLPPDRRARLGLGYVPQGREIFPRLTVEENLRAGLAARADGARHLPEELIYDLFPVLAEMKGRMGGNLSGGQQQQLAIARALAGQPSVLLLDEPTEGIQPSIIQQIERALLRLKEESRLTIVLVEQYFDFARRIADHFFLIERGDIALQGAAGALSDERIKQHLMF